MIYNEVLLTRKTPSGNANRHIFCAAGNNKKIISKTVAFRAKLWYLCLLPRKELISMAKKHANGEGNIRKRADGRWEGRYTAGYNAETGKRIIKNVLGKTQAECKAKLAAAMEAAKGVDISRADEYTVATWLRSWYDIYARTLRCGLHSPHLHPCNQAEARRGRTNHGQLHDAGDVSQSKRDERTEYPSAHLLPFLRISACGSRCGSGSCPAF